MSISNTRQPRQIRYAFLVDQNVADSNNDRRYNAVIGEEFAHICIHEALIMQVKSIEDFLEIQQHEARISAAAVVGSAETETRPGA